MTGSIPHTREVIFLVGLPGAGKSSFYRYRFAATHVLISKDRMKSRKARERRQLKWLREALENGRSVVIDNTQPSRASRAGSLKVARDLGARAVAYYFPIAVEESSRRNGGPGRTRVPEVAIFSAARELEPPTPNEGFSEIYVVRYRSPNEFEVNREEVFTNSPQLDEPTLPPELID